MDEQIIAMLIFVVIISALVNVVVDKIRDWYRVRHNVQEEPEQMLELLPEVMTPPPLPPQPARPQNGSNVISGQLGEQRSTVLPALPRMVTRERRIDEFPKCPIHKCRNRVGEEQVIFWNPDLGRYRCYKGHYFTGRES